MDFFLQNHEIWPQTESRNSGDHELWNHEMRGFPVFFLFPEQQKMLLKNLKTLLVFFTNWLLILKKEVISYAKDQRVGQTKVLDSSTPYLSVIHADNLAPAIRRKKVAWETFR